MNHNVNAIIQLMHYNTDFGNNLCSILDRLGCSRKDLADVTGLSRASISRYCNSQRLPRNEGRSLGQLIDGIVSLAEKLQADGLDRKTVGIHCDACQKRLRLEPAEGLLLACVLDYLCDKL